MYLCSRPCAGDPDRCLSAAAQTGGLGVSDYDGPGRRAGSRTGDVRQTPGKPAARRTVRRSLTDLHWPRIRACAGRLRLIISWHQSLSLSCSCTTSGQCDCLHRHAAKRYSRTYSCGRPLPWFDCSQTGSIMGAQRTSANGGVLRTSSSGSRHSNGVNPESAPEYMQTFRLLAKDPNSLHVDRLVPPQLLSLNLQLITTSSACCYDLPCALSRKELRIHCLASQWPLLHANHSAALFPGVNMHCLTEPRRHPANTHGRLNVAAPRAEQGWRHSGGRAPAQSSSWLRSSARRWWTSMPRTPASSPT